MHRASPVASLLIILALATALAFLASFLTLYDTLRPAPPKGFAEPDQLITISFILDGHPQGVSRPQIDLVQEASTGLESAVGITSNLVRWSTDGRNGEVSSEWVTTEYFGGLRPRVLIGRGLEPADHAVDATPVAVLSHRFWEHQFGGRTDVVGQTLSLEIEQPGPAGSSWERVGAVRIVGVMAPEVEASFGQGTAMWLPADPLVSTRFATMGVPDIANRIALYRVIGRTTGERSLDSVERELIAGLVGDGADAIVPAEGRLRVDPGFTFNPPARDEQLRQLQLLLTLTLLVALVAAINTGLYLLARAPARTREMAIREALGATKLRLAQQLCVESVVFLLVALILALILAAPLNGQLRTLPFFQNADWRIGTILDPGIVGILTVVALSMAAISAAAPIAVMNRSGIHSGTRKLGHPISGFQFAGTTLQIVIAGVVTAVTLGLAAYAWELEQRDLGYDRERVVVIVPVFAQSMHFAQNSLEAHQSRRDRVRVALDGITAFEEIGFGLPVPGGKFRITMGVQAWSVDGESVDVQSVSSDIGYGSTLGLRVLHGAWPEPGDPSSVVIERRLAQLLFGRADVVGETFEVTAFPGEPPARTVSAVIEDVVLAHPDDDQDPLLFVEATPFANLDRIILKTSLSPARVREAIQDRIESGALELEIQDVYALDAQFLRIVAEDRARFRVTLVAALLTIALAAIGFYGTQRFLADAHRREFAIRASIGASPSALFRLAILRAVRLGLPGLVLAAPTAWIAVELLEPGLLPSDQSPFAMVGTASIALLVVLLSAALAPAWRSAHAPPAAHLKDD
ncbi:FtsX-like permease family protein [Wenzhouxiangella sp. XN79A]|uniref:ABC transporter permease n=1 Tax=Wenzhouxiangella sp. XN79A TaxID=2724193 RepID=UPI00144AD54B|nr:FtsX-like permease family protein [Wenzhouxiangella sp. XN79A]